jgi:modulator of FtsH protease HflC
MRFMRYLVAGVLLMLFAFINMPMFFQIDTTEHVIVTQFGRPLRAITRPGLSVKLPEPIQSVIRLDKRVQLHDLSQTEFLTRDKKNILVEAYATWQVRDPIQFFTSVQDTAGANARLSDIMASELGSALGRNELGHLVTTESHRMQLSAMLDHVTQQVNQRTVTYGFEVTDVRIKQLNFPRANRESVFNRMRAERSRIARHLRSEGKEAAIKIRAEADAERVTILSQARREAERLRGEAEGEAIRIYAEAFGQDPEFYQFLRTLQAYDKLLTDGTTLILPADSALLKYLNPVDNTSIQMPSAMDLQPRSTPENRLERSGHERHGENRAE